MMKGIQIHNQWKENETKLRVLLIKPGASTIYNLKVTCGQILQQIRCIVNHDNILNILTVIINLFLLQYTLIVNVELYCIINFRDLYRLRAN